ncbi:MAG: small subunit ribosomal protein S1 [Bradymonadia bacterium]|jgi:small subunit ribosomal protein S1
MNMTEPTEPTAIKATEPTATETPATETPQEPVNAGFAGRTVRVGDIVVGRIVKITGNVAFVDYGARSEGYIELGELRNADGTLSIEEGLELEAEVVQTRGAIKLSTKKVQATKSLAGIEEAWKNQTPIDGKIVGVNKGGYEIRLGGVRAFCPNSQLAERFVREPLTEVGKTYPFIISEYGKGKSIVVTRRPLLVKEKTERSTVITGDVTVGETRQATVTRLQPFGAFCDIGAGLEGLLHVSEISHTRINHPRDLINEGDAIEVKIIRVDKEKGRIALSIKAMTEDPWSTFVATLKPGQALKGKVERLQDFGAFINIAPGIDGLMHVSVISTNRIEHPSEVLTVGEEIDVVVEKVDSERKRISLMAPDVAETRKPVDLTFKVGDKVKGKVHKVEGFGVFLDVDGIVGLIPNGEMDTERGADHTRMFPVGTELEVKVLGIDKGRQLRIRLSRKALKFHDEEIAMKEYRDKQKAAPASLGTFGDLLQGFLKK